MSYLTNREAAKIIGIHPGTLTQWRNKGRGPKFLRLGDGKQPRIRYTDTDVKAWMDQYNMTPEAREKAGAVA
jgi:predicted site-specific integrase-resolvase